MPSINDREGFLRNVLRADAVTCLACGLLMSAAARPLGELLELPPALLRYAGLALFPIAAFMAWVGARALRAPLAVATVIAGNLSWVIGTAWLMLGDVVAPNTLGQLFLAAQGLTVLVLTGCEARGAARLALRPGNRDNDGALV